MERDSLLHRAIPWVVAAVVAGALTLAGYAALAELMRVPDVPGEPLGTGTVIWTQREVCDESGCEMVPIDGAAEKIRAFVESEMPEEPRDTGVYQGSGDQVLVIDGREALRWKAGPEVRRKGDGWEICNAAETVCEDFPALP